MSPFRHHRHYRRLLALIGCLALGSLAPPAGAVLNLADAPLFLTVSVTPNLILTMDDSYSMWSAYVPDSIDSDVATRRFKANSYNALYYNPAVTYDIPVRGDGVSYTTSFTAARLNGFDAGKGTLNLNSAYRATVSYDHSGTTPTTNGASEAAYYYLWYSKTSPPGAKPASCDNTTTDDDCYIKIAVGSGADIATGNATQQKQNFANWYSFYRTRALAAMSGAMGAVTSLKSNEVRLAWQALTSCNSFGTTCRGYDAINHENRMRTLDALKSGSATETHRTDFYNWLHRLDLSGATPNRTALKRAGEYYKTSGLNAPYVKEPYVDNSTYAFDGVTRELSCRKNFHIFFTDGLWNNVLNADTDPTLSAPADADSSNVTLPDGTGYTPRPPYRDINVATAPVYANSNSLADIAFRYWSGDLRGDLANKLTPHYVDRSGSSVAQYWNPRNDPASWQHMVNFTIGFGLSSTLVGACKYDSGASPVVADPNSPNCPVWGGNTYAGDYAALTAGTKNWPKINPNVTNPGREPDGHVYDLWHAAINSRGQFFSVDSPDALSSAFKSALTSILNANPSSAALAANSTSLQTGALIYQARFDSQDWHGQLIAYAVQGDGSIGNPQWDAATLMPVAASRNIFTHDGSGAKTFTNCNSSLNAAQRLALDTDAGGTVDNRCTERMAWLRGDAANEQRFAGGSFRNRTVSVLGDIVNSDPVYVKNENHGYAASAVTMPEKADYAAFVTAKASRTPMIYVGANDGMLHAFRADVGHANSGKEAFAYIPAGVYPNLSKLTSLSYSHRMFVDAPPIAGDAYFGGGWKTVLAGGLGGGGKSVFALDVSNPDGFGTANVLWEYADAADLGYTYSQPQIGRLQNGEWAAIFGNGYNSTSDKAFLYIVRLSDGVLIKKIATNASVANGLSTPYLHDANGDKIIDAVYAGDLQGNLWKFDLSAASAAAWSLGNGGNPLFVARNAASQVQPITSQPKSAPHPNGGILVYFGTGRYLQNSDPANTDVQSFYAVWDSGVALQHTRGDLQVQTIDSETDEFNYQARTTSANPVDWTGGRRGWYMDLIIPPGGGGERVVSTPLIKYGRVIFVTIKPSADACVPGGESWVMELDMVTGGRTATSSFDFNNDGQFNASDLLASGKTASGVKSSVGIIKTPVWLDSTTAPGVAFKELSGTSGNLMTLKNKGNTAAGQVVRRFWQQIF
jgi:type IV pilus assembly protein PilY1